MISMAVTVMAGVALARAFGKNDFYGVLAGVGTAVCGASATLATATMLPHYEDQQADIAFVIVAVNALSTAAMFVYVPLCIVLGFDSQEIGVMLGATIHDMAQVAGSGYAVSEPVGNTAVIVKLFRVSLLLPVALAVGLFRPPVTFRRRPRAIPWLCARLRRTVSGQQRRPIDAGVGTALCAGQTAMLELSTGGLLLAIGALGLGTSLSAVGMMGWRHVAIVIGTTLVILVAVAGGLVFIA